MRNFTLLYAVLRTAPGKPVLLGTFKTLEAADNASDAWHQEVRDKDPQIAEGFHFEVQTVIFYNE